MVAKKMAAKRRVAQKAPVKVYTFIDTNIFLDFYRSQNETSLGLLSKLETVKERVICTYQVEMEFLKNRQRAVIENLSRINLKIDASLPAVMHESQLDKSLKATKKDLERRKKELQGRAENIIAKPSAYDPIYKSLEAIFHSKNDHVLTRDMAIRHKIKRLAWRRFILGYPPRKSSDTSVGDALNWEWFVHCAKNFPGKYVIVSRDSDYGAQINNKAFLNDALKAEFRDRVGQKSITLTTKLSEALRMMEVPVTAAEEKVEREQMSISTSVGDAAESGSDRAARWEELFRMISDGDS